MSTATERPYLSGPKHFSFRKSSQKLSVNDRATPPQRDRRAIVSGTLKAAFFVLATLYFTVDAVFLRVSIPLSRWIARKRALIRMRKWIRSLGPYPSLALFALPVIVLEPVKPLAAYLVATGNFSAGMAILTVGEILKLVVVERLFKLCR